MSGGKGSSTTTTAQQGVNNSTNTPNPQAMAAYQAVLNQAQGVAGTPYVPYGGELVAPVNAQQYAGINNIDQNAGFALPYIQQASKYANAAAQPITAQQIQNYQNPYTQQVVNATEAQFQNQNAQQQSALVGNAAAQGALGGDRVGVAQANLAGQQSLAQNPVIAGLYSQGYSQALQEANTQQQAMAQGAYSLGNLGISGQNAALQGAGAEISAGTLEQQSQQAADQAAYQQFVTQQGFPYQQTQWLAGLTGGLGSLMGGQTSGTSQTYGTTTGPPPNPWNQIAGLGLAGLGVAGKTMGSAGGGRIRGFDTGGAPYGASGAPWSGVAGYVPSFSMAHGNTMPTAQPINFPTIKDPNANQPASVLDPTKDPAKFAQQITGASAGLGKITDYLSTPTSQDLEAQAEAEGGAYGGRVRGFDDGGTVGWGSGSLIDPDESIAPGPAVLQSGVGNVRGGESAPVGLAANPMASTRGSFIDETNDPATRERLMRLTEAEVGGQGPAAANAFMESVLNRAAARGQTLKEAMNDSGYYPNVSLRGKSPSDRALYGDALNNVLGGSNVSKYATGNASGTVGFAGGPQTYSPGTGERFGLEGSDRPWGNTMAYAQNASGVDPDKYSDVPDIITGQRRAAGVGNAMAYAPTRDEELNARPGTSGAGQGKRGFLGLSDAASMGLISAGFGMMASRSPFLGVGIGEGGLAGVGAYTAEKQREQKEAAQKVTQGQGQQRIDLAVEQLRQHAEDARKALSQKQEQHEVPTGYQRTPQGTLQAVPGGPQDPATMAAAAKAKMVTALSDNATEIASRQIIGGDLSALTNVGRGAQGDAKITAIKNRGAQILTEEMGMSPAEAAQFMSAKLQSFKASGVGQTAEARTAGTREANLNIILKATEAAIPAALEASDKLGRTGFVPLNQIIQKGQVMTSNPELREFGMANLQLAEHWARAMNPTGVMRESDRDKALSFLSTADSPETYRRVVAQLQKQITRERDAVHSQREPVPGGAAPSEAAGAPATTATLPDAARSALKEGINTTFGNGQVWTLKNGQPVQVK